jgi:hypothetical protein
MAHVMSVCEKIRDVSMLARVVKCAGVMEIFQYKRAGKGSSVSSSEDLLCVTLYPEISSDVTS